VSTGEILLDILTSKAILSVGVSNDYFRFSSDNDLVEFESGNAMNEPKYIAIQAAIETAVAEIVIQGQEQGYWKYYLGD
jgi:curli production assembly/transport component CsgG